MITRNLAVYSVVRYDRSLYRHCSIFADSLNSSFFFSSNISMILLN
jgi:hypothetical protein